MLSAFLDNLTTVLLMVPITFLLADALDIDPIPLVIIEILVSNIGGTATLIGDPPNILIAGATDLTFMRVHRQPRADRRADLRRRDGGLYLVYRRQLQVAPEARQRVMELDAARSIEDLDELKRTVPMLIGTILLFFAHQALHIEPATVAMTGATVMLLVSRQSLEKSLAGIEWPTLFFFIGLFVMVGALEETGAIDEVAEGIASITAGDRTRRAAGHHLGVGDRLGHRRQHPLHRRDDPRRRAAPGRQRRRRRLLVGARAGRLLRRQRDPGRRRRQRRRRRHGRARRTADRLRRRSSRSGSPSRWSR